MGGDAQVDQHPGGGARIMLAAGGAIDPFWGMYAQHKTPEVHKILETYRIGDLVRLLVHGCVWAVQKLQIPRPAMPACLAKSGLTVSTYLALWLVHASEIPYQSSNSNKQCPAQNFQPSVGCKVGSCFHTPYIALLPGRGSRSRPAQAGGMPEWFFHHCPAWQVKAMLVASIAGCTSCCSVSKHNAPCGKFRAHHAVHA